MTTSTPVTAFPTPEESLALRVCLLDGDPALEAWRKLAAIWKPEATGFGWMAPLLMKQLRRLQPDDPWVRQNPHFLTLCQLKGGAITEFAQRTLTVLEQAAVPTLALKGLALGASVYPSPELRAVSDLDVLVAGRDFSRASAALEASGLLPARGAPASAEDLRANHAHVFSSRRRHEPMIDLHWHVLASARGDDDDAPFWAEARPLVIGKAKTLGLCPEDQLLHALVHGVRWTRMAHVRWVADAVMILRASREDFRVDRFLEMTERYDVVIPVQEGLGFVAALIGEGQELLEKVQSLQRSAFAKRAFKARATSYEDRSVADRIALRVETALWTRRARRKRD